MKLSKTTKKLNTKLLSAIQKLKEQAERELVGLVNITHTVEFDHFPGSLLVTCHFKNELELAVAKELEKSFQKKLHALLFKQGILLKNPSHNLRFWLLK